MARKPTDLRRVVLLPLGNNQKQGLESTSEGSPAEKNDVIFMTGGQCRCDVS